VSKKKTKRSLALFSLGKGAYVLAKGEVSVGAEEGFPQVLTDAEEWGS